MFSRAFRCRSASPAAASFFRSAALAAASSVAENRM